MRTDNTLRFTLDLRLLCLALGLMLAAVPAPCEQSSPNEKSSSLPAVEKDIAYGPSGDQHMLDLYLPDKKGFATVVFTYGGGWHTGSRKSVSPIGQRLQKLGYGCALISHRLSPKDKFPAQIEDLAAAFAWVRANIASKGGDPRRIVLMGHSSGAHLSLLLAADPIYLKHHKLSPVDIAGVVGLSTPVDLEPRKDGKGFGDALMGGRGADAFSRDANTLREASPLYHLSKDLPATLLVVGERDFPMLEGDAMAFAQKAAELKASVRTFVGKDRDHMGVVKSLLEDESPIQREVLAFLTKVTK